MFVGTASDVGKSVVATGFCRILLQDGYRPAPFKAQNMSLNSYVTPEGLEIGRAQAVQAEAAGIPCSTDMNPVLLKPTGDLHAQLVLHGRPAGSQSAHEYFLQQDKRALWEEVKKAFDRLAATSNPVVMEGAGSISELNLRQRDITNMRIALHAGADVYLVADIDRGGVFGSVYGTIALLPPEERALVKGILINKFRGDNRLFVEGRRMMEELTGVPVVGVLPYYKHIHIEEEDSVALQQKHRHSRPGLLNIAVVALPHLSNFTDFLLLERTDTLHVYYTDDPRELAAAEIIILPGSKNSIGDLLHIRQNGAAAAVQQAAQKGRTVIGICGGYQMMGLSLADPHGVEGEPRTIEGLGLLPVHTELEKEKTTLRRRFRFRPEDTLSAVPAGSAAPGSAPWCEGYEIHMGRTRTPLASPLNYLEDDSTDGYFLSHRCWGTYMHGILDNAVVVDRLLEEVAGPSHTLQPRDHGGFKQRQYDLLAEHIRQHTDLAYIYHHLQQP